MEKQNNTTPPKTKSLLLPIIALIFAITPIFWWLRDIPIVGYVFLFVFLISSFGIISTTIAAIIGIIALIPWKKKRITITGLIFSVLAILSPIIWRVALALGVLEYIMSYK